MNGDGHLDIFFKPTSSIEFGSSTAFTREGLTPSPSYIFIYFISSCSFAPWEQPEQ